MTNVSVAAHFDGNHIVLDEPIELAPNTQLIVTILPAQQLDEHAAWIVLARHGLANAYGDDEVEYTLDAVKELNPAYEGR